MSKCAQISFSVSRVCRISSVVGLSGMNFSMRQILSDSKNEQALSLMACLSIFSSKAGPTNLAGSYGVLEHINGGSVKM